MKFLITFFLSLFLTLQISAADSAKEIVLSEDNTLVLNTAFTGKSTTQLMQDATKLDANLKSGYPIYLFQYTPGGSIQAGLELIEFLNGLNRPVHTITLFSASMGFQTVQHLGERYILKYGVLMSHKARGAFSGEFGGGISQLDSRYQLWLRRIELMDRKTVERTEGKQTLKSYIEAYTPELWLNGQEAVEKGYADEVVTVKCDLSMQGTKRKVIDFGFFSIVARFSECPIKTYPLSISATLVTNKGSMDLDEFLEKNGKFGENCGTIETVDSSDDSFSSGFYYDRYDDNKETVKEKTTEELCAKDPKLTLKKIKDEVEKQEKELSKSLRDNVIYSY